MDMTQEELDKILEDHAKWARNEDGGKRADLEGADLSYADLRFANLSYAKLADANLDHADLADADLSYANLEDANLSYANLRRANLRFADLSYADLEDANLKHADLEDAKFSLNIPIVNNIDLKIYEEIKDDLTKLNMGDWHTECGTAHCRAGWAIHLAGELGYELERLTTSYLAGRLIYEKSRPGVPVPNFFATNEEALQSIKKDASVCNKRKEVKK